MMMALAVAAVLWQTGSPRSDSTIRIPVAPGVELAGTITEPGSGAPEAVAVLISVAGPDDRHLSIGPHRLFGAWADELAVAGIATLRTDDRGVGASGGDWRQTTFADRASDLCAALRTLRARFPNVRPGLIGMSEGGGLALRAAAQCGPVKFLVLLSTPLRPGGVELAAQVDRLLALAPVPESTKVAFKAEASRLTRVAGAPPPVGGRDSVLAVLRGPFGPNLLPPFRFVPRDPEGQAAFLLSPWYQSQLHYDVTADLAARQVPVLGIYGRLDRNIEPEPNAEVLRASGAGASVHLLDSLNHVLQEARTGLPDEYPRLPRGIAPAVTRLVIDWILRPRSDSLNPRGH